MIRSICTGAACAENTLVPAEASGVLNELSRGGQAQNSPGIWLIIVFYRRLSFICLFCVRRIDIRVLVAVELVDVGAEAQCVVRSSIVAWVSKL